MVQCIEVFPDDCALGTLDHFPLWSSFVRSFFRLAGPSICPPPFYALLGAGDYDGRSFFFLFFSTIDESQYI